MYVEKRYSVWDMFLWTRRETFVLLLYALVVAVLFEVGDMRWLRLPWTPIAVVGTAVAFLIGFQSNAAYGRTWEARQIWGGIVNESRTWAIFARDMVTNEHATEPAGEEELADHRTCLVHRHIAWLAALRHAMRQPRSWEMFARTGSNREWYDKLLIPERDKTLAEDLESLLSAEDRAAIAGKTNQAAAIMALQSNHLRRLKEIGLIWEFSFLEMEGVLRELIGLQGKSERIKNFPYPRQYSTVGCDAVRVFLLLLPFGVIPEFSSMGEQIAAGYPLIGRYFVWAGVPFAAIVAWVFHTMHRIGTVGENPFEGTANDVPISTMARGIEIDMREILGEDPATIPKPLPVVQGAQM